MPKDDRSGFEFQPRYILIPTHRGGLWTPLRPLHEQEYGYVLVEINGLDVTYTWKDRVSAGVYKQPDIPPCEIPIGVSGRSEKHPGPEPEDAEIHEGMAHVAGPDGPVPRVHP
jgi:hypothetical protein